MTSLLKPINSNVSASQHAQPPSPSLLVPTNPAFDDDAPTGGILINRRRPSELAVDTLFANGNATAGTGNSPTSPASVTAASRHKATDSTSSRGSLAAPGRDLPASPLLSSTEIKGDITLPAVLAGPAPVATKIRFAPLPSPRRGRSLSTGRNLVRNATLEPDGTRKESLASKRADGDWDGDEEAVEDEDAEDDDDDEDDEGKRSWRKSMGMGWTRTGSNSGGSFSSGSFGATTGSYTKRFLKPLMSPTFSDKDKEPDMLLPKADFGAPLKKSVSTGGLMGSSPFRTSKEEQRRRSFLPGSSSSSGAGDSKRSRFSHRSTSSFEQPDFSSLSSSLGGQGVAENVRLQAGLEGVAKQVTPRPVKMLNGRIYGKRLGDPPAPVSHAPDPAFVEWGGIMGDRGGGLGSNDPNKKSVIQDDRAGAASLGSNSRANEDEDDGSGLAWVKKRREARERQRRESEAAEQLKGLVEEQAAAQPAETRRLTESTLKAQEELPNIAVVPPDVSDMAHAPDHLVEKIFVPTAKDRSQRHDVDYAAEDDSDSSDGADQAAAEDEDEDDDDNGDQYSDDDDEDILLEEEAKRWVCYAHSATDDDADSPLFSGPHRAPQVSRSWSEASINQRARRGKAGDQEARCTTRRTQNKTVRQNREPGACSGKQL